MLLFFLSLSICLLLICLFSRYIAYFIVLGFSFSYEYTEPIIHATLACMMDVLYDWGKCYLSLFLSGSRTFPQTPINASRIFNVLLWNNVAYVRCFWKISFSEHPPYTHCLLYTSPSPRDRHRSRMPSSA